MPMRKQHHISRKQPSHLQQTILVLPLALTLFVSTSAKADDNGDMTSTKHSYHISSGSLSQVLSQFAGSAGILFSADAKLTDGKSSQGLDGDYTVTEGFQKLLVGSGLTYIFTGKNTVTLQVADNQSQSNTTALPAVKVTGAAVYESNDPYNPDGMVFIYRIK